MDVPGAATWPGWVRRVLAGPGISLAFLWGLAEATLFFIVPDVLLSLVGAYDARRALRHVLAAIVGALVGGAVMFGFAASSQTEAGALVAKVPFVRPAMFDRVESEFKSDSAMALFRGPIAGVPYKIYAVQAPRHVALWKFLLISIPARGARFVLLWTIAALAGFALRQWCPTRPLVSAYVHAVLWTGFYAFYWWRI
jgi:membrane protein YqaA with SNARE-associated domain